MLQLECPAFGVVLASIRNLESPIAVVSVVRIAIDEACQFLEEVSRGANQYRTHDAHTHAGRLVSATKEVSACLRAVIGFKTV